MQQPNELLEFLEKHFEECHEFLSRLRRLGEDLVSIISWLPGSTQVSEAS